MYFYIFVQTECVLMDKTGVCVGVCSGYRKIFAQRALPPRLIIRFRERNFTLIMFFKLKLGNTFSLRRLFYIVLATGLGRSKNIFWNKHPHIRGTWLLEPESGSASRSETLVVGL